MIPFDLVGTLHDSLKSSRRPPDGLLHPSGDLCGSLRHSQLNAAGAPKRAPDLADEVVLMTGTLWHELAHRALVAAGLPFMQEVRLTPWLPEGWAGTADWIFWSEQYRAFVLGDMKTIKGDGISWIEKDGVKSEHLWQLSAYWHALYDMGLPLVEGFGVLYWPKDRGTGGGSPSPTVQECAPFERELVHGVMAERWELTSAYLTELSQNLVGVAAIHGVGYRPELYLNDYLALEQERVQKLVWNKKAGAWDVKLVPHWSAAYCPYDAPLCSCREQGTTKIGEFRIDSGPDLTVSYYPRRGFTIDYPELEPNLPEIRKRKKELNGA